jgi:hypothetical protein
MNFLIQESQPSFCVLTRSLAWKFAMEYQLCEGFRQAKVVWALDIDDLLSEVAASNATVTIVELNQDSVVDDCRKIDKATTGLPRARFFAVAEPGLKNWLPLIRVCGFADSYWSVHRLERMTNAIRRCMQTLSNDAKSIEDRVSERLPWRPCSEGQKKASAI